MPLLTSIARSSLHRSHRLRGPLVLLATVAAIATFMFAGPVAATPANTNASSASATASAAALNAAGGAESAARAAADGVDAESAPATGILPIAPAAVARHAAPAVVPTVPRSSSTPAKSTVAEHPAAAGASPSGYGCGPALAYLRAHAAPGFTFQCPGYSYGHQAMTCVNHAPQCAGQRLITITVPCAAAYMNEAHNSWVLIGQATGIDPYGWCH